MSLELDNDQYQQALRDAVNDIAILAVRHAVDTRNLLIEFDPNRGQGPHTEHTLTISVRDSDLAVTADNVPHEWLSTGTGFIDTRLSRLAQTLLAELDKKALAARRLL